MKNMAFNKNQIKKILYKEKPIASYFKTIPNSSDDVEDGSIIYKAVTSVSDLYFQIPFKDRPVNLNLDEPAQLLIRWLEVTE